MAGRCTAAAATVVTLPRRSALGRRKLVPSSALWLRSSPADVSSDGFKPNAVASRDEDVVEGSIEDATLVISLALREGTGLGLQRNAYQDTSAHGCFA